MHAVKKQWQWLTDHHAAVRVLCFIFFNIAFFTYVVLFFGALFEKGKAPSYDASNEASISAGCQIPPMGLDAYYLGPDSLANKTPIRYGSSNPFKFETFWTKVWDIKVLAEKEACFDVYLLEELSNSSEVVFCLFGKAEGMYFIKYRNLGGRYFLGRLSGRLLSLNDPLVHGSMA